MYQVALNPGQQTVVNAAIKWYKYSNDPLFQFEGPPGTGKSVVLHAIKQALDPTGEISEAAAYNGAAAVVLRTKGFESAMTLHSLLYQPTEVKRLDENGKEITDDYFGTATYEPGFIPKPTPGLKLLFIDESGTAPMYMRREIESRGIRIVACGDLQQLPTVDDEPGFLVDGTIYHLTDIMRQAANNAIIWLSQRLIRGLPIHEGNYGNVLVIEEDQLTDQMIAAADVVLCGKNKTRDSLNARIRKNIIHTDSVLPRFGERVVCRKNNKRKDIDGIFLANGLVGSVVNYPEVDGFDGSNFTIDFLPNIMRIPFNGLLVDYKYFTAPYEYREKLKFNKYNQGEKFEFAYGLTTHLAQGCEWSRGIYIQEYLNKDINNNLNYVGISRFRDFCIYVIPKQNKYYNGYNLFNKTH